MEHIVFNVTMSMLHNGSYATDKDDNVTNVMWWIEYPALLTAAQIIVPSLSVLGIVVNVITIVAVCTPVLRQNINSILIGNLSASQLLYCMTVLPSQSAIFHDPSKDWPHLFCVFVASIRIELAGTTLGLLCAIAFYRYLNVVHIQLYRKYSAPCPIIILLAVCWLNSLAFALPPAFGVWGSLTFEKRVSACTFSGDKSNRISTVTIGFILPVIFILSCYSRIGCVAFESQQRMRSYKKSAQHKRLSFRQKISRESLRLATMMAIIFFVYIIVTLPYMLVHSVDGNMRMPVHHVWSSILAWFLYCINPFIYTAMDTNFQTAYREILTFKVCIVGRRFFKTVSSFRSHRADSIASNRSASVMREVEAESKHAQQNGSQKLSHLETTLNGDTNGTVNSVTPGGCDLSKTGENPQLIKMQNNSKDYGDGVAV